MAAMKNQLHPATLAAQAAGYVDPATGGLTPPVQPSTTYARRPDYDLTAPGFIYGRDDSNIVRIAEAALAKLEGAEAALLFPSGMAAIAALFRTVPGGSAVVIQSGIYWGTTKWAREFCARRDIRLVEVDAADAGQLRDAVAGVKPCLVWIETPSNPWLKIVNVAEAAKSAHQAGALLAVDSTAATPILSHPLMLGADIVMHSATKAINGHSDVLAGVLLTDKTTHPVWQAIAADRHDAGAVLGPFEAWLLLRGMRTLALRVQRMSENAMATARFLDDHPAVEAVWYPGLAGHPGHELAKAQMAGGFGGLMSFLVQGGAKEALAVCGRLRVIHRATSLGGVESLIEHRFTVEPQGNGIPPNLLRLSVGIEHVDDLVADLDQALA